MAFGRDVDYGAYPQSTYLDQRKGDVVWFYEDAGDACGITGIPAADEYEGPATGLPRDRLAGYTYPAVVQGAAGDVPVGV